MNERRELVGNLGLPLFFLGFVYTVTDRGKLLYLVSFEVVVSASNGVSAGTVY